MLQPFLVSTGVVALAEVGDKTQLLSLILAVRYRKPVPIMLGVLVATLVSHAAAGGIGTLLSSVLSPAILNPDFPLGAPAVLFGPWRCL